MVRGRRPKPPCQITLHWIFNFAEVCLAWQLVRLNAVRVRIFATSLAPATGRHRRQVTLSAQSRRSAARRGRHRLRRGDQVDSARGGRARLWAVAPRRSAPATRPSAPTRTHQGALQEGQAAPARGQGRRGGRMLRHGDRDRPSRRRCSPGVCGRTGQDGQRRRAPGCHAGRADDRVPRPAPRQEKRRPAGRGPTQSRPAGTRAPSNAGPGRTIWGCSAGARGGPRSAPRPPVRKAAPPLWTTRRPHRRTAGHWQPRACLAGVGGGRAPRRRPSARRARDRRCSLRETGGCARCSRPAPGRPSYR